MGMREGEARERNGDGEVCAGRKKMEMEMGGF